MQGPSSPSEVIFVFFLLKPSELEKLFWWSAEPGWRGNRLIVLCEELVIMFIAGGGEAEQLSNRLLSTMSASGFIQFSTLLLVTPIDFGSHGSIHTLVHLVTNSPMERFPQL